VLVNRTESITANSKPSETSSRKRLWKVVVLSQIRPSQCWPSACH